jgi:hypothetical protein
MERRTADGLMYHAPLIYFPEAGAALRRVGERLRLRGFYELHYRCEQFGSYLQGRRLRR